MLQVHWDPNFYSSLGQNLRTSSYIWENFFAVLVILSGLMFFLYLIGNMQVCIIYTSRIKLIIIYLNVIYKNYVSCWQIYLQSRTAKAEEMRLKGQEIEQWNGFRKLIFILKISTHNIVFFNPEKLATCQELAFLLQNLEASSWNLITSFHTSEVLFRYSLEETIRISKE